MQPQTVTTGGPRTSRKLAQGAGLLSSASFAGQAVAAAAALFSARFLSPQDYGGFALGTALGMFTLGVGNTGPSQWLVSRRLTLDERSVGEAKTLASVINGGGAVVAGLLAAIMAVFTSHSGAALTLACIGASTLITTIWPIQLASLQATESFAAISLSLFMARLVRSLGTLGMAVAGAGVAALAIPLVLAALIQVGVGRCYAVPMAGRPMGVWQLRKTSVGSVSWIVAAGLLGTAVAQADYAALALVGSVSTLGTYFFAYQIAGQSAAVASSMADSFFVTDARHGTDNFRFATVATTAVTTSLLATIALLAEELERWMWAGSWSEAVPTIQVVCLVLPLRLLMPILRSNRLLAGADRLWTFEASFVGGLTFVGALAAGLLFEEVERVALVALAASSLAVIVVLYRMDRRTAVYASCTYAVIAGAAGVWSGL